VDGAEDAELQYDLVACATRGGCGGRRSELGTDEFFVGTYPTKGCSTKNGVAYWSGGGSPEEVSRGDLPGEQERIFCGDYQVASVGRGADDSNSHQASAIVNYVVDEGSSPMGVSFAVRILGANVTYIVLLACNNVINETSQTECFDAEDISISRHWPPAHQQRFSREKEPRGFRLTLNVVNEQLCVFCGYPMYYFRRKIAPIVGFSSYLV
jgi:hypothetical protein